MHYAILFEHPDCFSALLDCDRICINSSNNLPRTPFEFALDHFQLESLSSLLKYAYSSFTETEFPLHHAIINDDIGAVSTLLSDPSIDANSTDNNRCTPLLAAVILNKPEMIRLLLQHNSLIVNRQYLDDNTVLHYATYFGYTACVQELLQHPSIDTSLANEYFNTPLDLAFSQSSIACIDFSSGLEIDTHAAETSLGNKFWILRLVLLSHLSIC